MLPICLIFSSQELIIQLNIRFKCYEYKIRLAGPWVSHVLSVRELDWSPNGQQLEFLSSRTKCHCLGYVLCANGLQIQNRNITVSLRRVTEIFTCTEWFNTNFSCPTYYKPPSFSESTPRVANASTPPNLVSTKTQQNYAHSLTPGTQQGFWCMTLQMTREKLRCAWPSCSLYPLITHRMKTCLPLDSSDLMSHAVRLCMTWCLINRELFPGPTQLGLG